MKYLINRVVLPWFRKRLPPLSPEEQVVLEAGDLWFEKTFFTGKPDWEGLFRLPKPTLSAAETDFLDHEVDQLCALVNDWEVSHQHHDLPKAAWEFIKQQRFWGLTLPKEHGGHGFSPLAHSAIIAKLATRSIALAYTVMVPNSLGVSIFIQQFGTPEQQEYYLPRLAQGEEISCFALTTTDSGSDATSIADTGIITQGNFGGREVLGIRLNFDKRYITLAPVATLIGLAFQLYDPENLLGTQKEYGISLALLPSDVAGIEIGARHDPSGLGFMNGPIRGKEVFIPLDYLIGGVEQAGCGWQMILSCLSLGRGLSLPALSSGIVQLATRTSSAYAMTRQQFGVSIGNFEGIQEALGRMVGLNYCCEAVRRFTGLAVASGKRPSVAAAISKYHLTEIAQRVMIDAMNIHGGAAVQIGPSNLLVNWYLATQVNVVVEGANILTRSLIIYGQGVLRCHPFLRHLIHTSMRRPQMFRRLLYRQLRFSIAAFFRGIWQGFTGGLFIRAPSHPCARQIKQLTRMSSAFVVLTEWSLLVLGKQFKRREALSARLGDILSYLYLAASVLKRFEDSGRAKEELVLLQWGLSYCLDHINSAIEQILVNFPSRLVANFLKFLLFPWGLGNYKPSDTLTQQLATQIQHDFSWRERLTASCYCGAEVGEIHVLDQALQAILDDSPEADRLREAVIKVDEF